MNRFGLIRENDSEPIDSGVQKVWASILSAATQSGDANSVAENIDFHAARPFWYVRNYRFKWWQWLFWPVTCSKISIGRRQIDHQFKDYSDHSRLVNALDIALSDLEFGRCPLTTRERWLVRRKILTLRLSHAEVRNAFRSCALLCKRGQPIQIRTQPKSVYWLCRIGRDTSASIFALAMLAMSWLLPNGDGTACSWTGFALVAQYFLIFWMLFQLVGPSWAKAQQTLEKIAFITQ